MKITLKPSNDVDEEMMRKIKEQVENVFHCPIVIKKDFNHLSHAYDNQRKQYLASKLIESLASNEKLQNEKIIGIVTVDLYSPHLNFVFGEADFLSSTAIMSLYRLKQEYYGQPADKGLLITRACKEIIHELGHTLGLQHCPNLRCVMHYSNGLADTDWKDLYFCEKCQPKLRI
jgi:archaemetzincin